jgi:hypothetical protein
MFKMFAFVVIPLALLAVGVWWVATNPDRVLGVDGEQLGSSLARETPEPGGGECSREEGRRWECGVEVDAGSGVARRYRLTTDGEGCWDAVRASGSGKKLSGCVDLWDYAWPQDLDGN